MKIFITGGTGFIGRHLVKGLLQADHQVSVLSRSAGESAQPGLTYIKGDPTEPGEWQEAAAAHEAVINLAGASLFRPWTEKNKKLIRESRIRTTGNLAEALSGDKVATAVLISASAVGYYGDRGDEVVDEQAEPGDDFLARVCVAWEKEAEKCASAGIRVVRSRFGVVLGPDGGALAKMMPAFKLGLGSPLGSGKQWFSWIHIDDLVGILSYLLTARELEGAVNCMSPNPVTNRQFTKSLASALSRPAILPAVPAFLLKTFLGESSQIVLNSQRVKPKVLLDQGYDFAYPDIQGALCQITSE